MELTNSTSRPQPYESIDGLDDEILHIRNQIQELTKHRRLITNTLLSSTKIQNQLNNNNNNNDTSSTSSSPDLFTDETPLSTSPSTTPDLTTHQTNMHRLSFTITTFPFTDPSPTNPNNPHHLHGRLLGIRLDHCSRSGTFQKPYYILLRRVEDGGEEWRVHRHTIPAFVGLGRLEEEFLPLRNSMGNEGSSDGAGARASERDRRSGQDLHAFVRKIRHELICWELRKEAIEFLKDELGLLGTATAKLKDTVQGEDQDEEMDETSSTSSPSPEPSGLYGIAAIEPTAHEARQARITWTDGTIGRIKINNRGLVERAVVVGEGGRIRGVENLLVDGESRVEELVGRLRVLVGGT